MATDVESAMFPACGGESTELAMLHVRAGEPVDARVVTDGVMIGVDEDHLEILVRGVLVHPVRVEHAKIAASTPCAFFGNCPLVPLELELRDTLVLGLTVLNTLLHGTLTTSAADTNCERLHAWLAYAGGESVRVTESHCISEEDNLDSNVQLQARTRPQGIRNT